MIQQLAPAFSQEAKHRDLLTAACPSGGPIRLTPRGSRPFLRPLSGSNSRASWSGGSETNRLGAEASFRRRSQDATGFRPEAAEKGLPVKEVKGRRIPTPASCWRSCNSHSTQVWRERAVRTESIRETTPHRGTKWRLLQPLNDLHIDQHLTADAEFPRLPVQTCHNPD